MAYRDREKLREYDRRRKAEMTAKGICYNCQKRPYTIGPRGGKICDECRTRFRLDNLDKEGKARKRAYDRHRIERTKEIVFGHYGGKCRRCGNDDHDVLDLHHIHGRGKGNREKWKGSASYLKMIKEKRYPKDLELLCANCHRKVHREQWNAKIEGISPYKVGPRDTGS